MSQESQNWYIDIAAPFGGFAPAYWSNTYATFGNKNQARAMTNVDLSDPTGFKQGPGLATLTTGTEAGAVTTLIKHILPVPPSADTTYAIGGAKLYQLTSSAVANAGDWPHTINKAAVTGEDGESIFVANGVLYYVYNHSGSAGDIGKFNLVDTFDDDWGSTVPTGAATLQDAPHPSVFGNDNVAYIGNGAFVAYYDPDTNTLDVQGLDLPTGAQVVGVSYLNSRVYASVNLPNTTGSNQSIGVVYVWQGVGVPSWDDFPNPRFAGKIGPILPFKSNMFVWYQEVGFTGGYKLGYISGNSIVEVEAYSGTLPNFAQVFEHEGQIAWVSDGNIFRWGAPHHRVPTAMSQYMDGGYSTVGGVATPFGTIMAASTQSTSYKLAKASGLDTNSTMKTLMYQVGRSIVDKVCVDYGPLDTGARTDITLRRDQGLGSLALTKEGQTGSITASNDSTRYQKMFAPNYEVQDEFSLEFSAASGSATNNMLIRRIRVWGHTVPTD